MDDTGGGPYDPASGMRDWYNPAPKPETQTGPSITWDEILKNFDAIVLDLHETFGADVETGIMHTRSWPWLETRILDLITKTDTRIHARLKHHFATP